MLSKEEIEKAKTIIRTLLFNEDGKVVPYIDFGNSDYDGWGGYTMEQYAKSLDIIFRYIEQLENKVKQLGKGQHSLIQTRRKWKNRYYKQRQKEVEDE